MPEDKDVVRLMCKPNGKSTGQAIVYMNTSQDVDFCITALHGQYIGTRYIEVFRHEGEGGCGGEGIREHPYRGCAGYDGLSMGLPDVAGDTGGSGEGMTAPFPWEQWGLGPSPAPGPPGPFNFGLMGQPNPMGGAMGQPNNLGVAPTAGSDMRGDGEANDQVYSWEALFDFLKKDGAETMPQLAMQVGGKGGFGGGFGAPMTAPTGQGSGAQAPRPHMEV
jgi:hypothetical protein